MTRILATLLALTTLPAHAQYMTAKSFTAACANPADAYQAACDAYLTGVTDALILSNVLGCEPADYDRAAIREAALTEAAKPERRDGSAMRPIFDAVLAVFPCTPMKVAP